MRRTTRWRLCALPWVALAAAAPATGTATEPPVEVRVDWGFGVALTDVHDAPATPLDETFRGEAVTVNAHLAAWRAWLGAELGVGYQYNLHRWQVLAGPAVRWRPAPFVLAASLRAGWATLGGNRWSHGGEGRAMVSPGAAAELELGPRWSVGVRWGLDLPVGTRRAVTQRFLATQGFRF